MTRRREFLLGGSAAAVLGLGAIGYGWRHFGNHYPPTPYDDLVAELADRDAAKMVGRAFLAANRGFSPSYAAKALRVRIAQKELNTVLSGEIASGQLTEVAHWLIPETLAGLCALAAKT